MPVLLVVALLAGVAITGNLADTNPVSTVAIVAGAGLVVFLILKT